MANFKQNVIRHKLGLLNIAEELNNVSRACKLMGFSRDTFYRYKAAKENDGVKALFDKSRRNSSLRMVTDCIRPMI